MNHCSWILKAIHHGLFIQGVSNIQSKSLQTDDRDWKFIAANRSFHSKSHWSYLIIFKWRTVIFLFASVIRLLDHLWFNCSRSESILSHSSLFSVSLMLSLLFFFFSLTFFRPFCIHSLEINQFSHSKFPPHIQSDGWNMNLIFESLIGNFIICITRIELKLSTEHNTF